MQATMPSSSNAYNGGHWSDSGTHPGDAEDPANAAAAASEVFRDFTWYSAMLLSHLFALEHAQLEREAAAEETRRRSASAHSPQLLMRAAMAAANAPAAPPSFSPTSAVPVASEGEDASKSGNKTETVEDAAVPHLPHLATQHRPHILLGFTTTTTTTAAAAAGDAGLAEISLLTDPETKWVAEEKAGVTDPAAPPVTGSTAALLAVFDAFYFPIELFPPATPHPNGEAGTTLGDTAGEADATLNAAATTAATAATATTAAADSSRNSSGVHDGEAGSAAAAPRVTPEALREAFHALLVLGQRCAAFALTFHGIVGADAATTAAGVDDGPAEETRMAHTVGNMCLSSEDEYHGAYGYNSSHAGSAGGGGGRHGSGTDSVTMQQAASAALQFMLQLACSCPCASLSYASQLCLAQALAVQPTPSSAAGWAARHQLLRFLPTLQPPSRALLADAAGVGHHPHAGPGAAPAGIASSTIPTTGSGTAATNNGRVPATQYVRAEDPMLWFDPTGAVHLLSAQRWWESAPTATPASRGRGASLVAYCGPLPATTALPTVQRLLMEEEQYMGPNGSAAAVLQSVLEAVSTEVTLNARVLPGSSSSLVHTSLRRRRGLHSSGSPRGGAGPGAPTSGDSLPEMEMSHSNTSSLHGGASGMRGGSPTLPAPSTSFSTAANSAGVGGPRGSSAIVAGGASAGPASPSSSSRLSKAAKRRRALLFALAQSHLLPPTLQLATAKTLLYGVFTDGGECPSYYMLLSLYPDILRAHHASLHYVLFEDGPLSVDVRLMVATMAASRHRCEYLVSRFTALLLRYAEEAMLDDDDDDAMTLTDVMDDYDSVYRGGGGGGGAGMNSSSSRHGVHSPLYAPPTSSSSPSGSHHYHHHQQQQPQQYIGGEGGEAGGASAAAPYQTPCRGQARQRWILHGPPARLRAVRHFIALAAHTPWVLNENDVRAVLAAGWTIPEVFQLIAIVAQVVPLCGFVMGMFVPAEPWTMTLLPLEVVERLGHRAVTEEGNVASGSGTNGGGGGGGSGMVSSGSSGALTGLRRNPVMAQDACPGPATPHQAASGRSLLGSAASGSDIATMTTAGSGANLAGGIGNAAGGAGASVDVFRRYAGEDNVVSEQRIKGSNATANPHTLWRSQFTWSEVGATSMEQYYPGAATLMNEEIECFFDVVRQLTKADCVGLMSPDYAPSYAFRSLQLYVQNLLGFMVEDYPYNDINKVLRRPAKWFAQVLTMRPETLTRSEVVRWYVPTTPPTGKPSDMSAESSLVTHQLKREIELLSVVDSAQGGHRGGIESASAHPDQLDNPPPTPAEAARDAAEAEALQTALTLQDERVLLLIALATMEARKEGLLHIMLRPVCTVLNNM